MSKHHRKSKWTLKIVLLVLLIMVLATITWLPTLPKRFANQALPALFGDHATYALLHVDPIKGVASYRDFILNQPDSFGPGTLLTSERVEIHFAPLSLIGEETEIKRIQFTSPVITLIRSSTGEINFNAIPQDPAIDVLRIKEVIANNAQVFYLDEVNQSSALDGIVTNATISAFDLKLTNRFPFDHHMEELHFEAPQILLSKTSKQLRKQFGKHRLHIGKLEVSSPFFTYEDNTITPLLLDINLTNFNAVAEDLRLGKPQAPEVPPGFFEITGGLSQEGSPAPFGLFGRIGPIVGRDTKIQGDLHVVGMDIDALRPLFFSTKPDRDLLLAAAAVGGKHFDLHQAFRGRVKEMSIKNFTSAPRGILTESHIIFGDLENTTAPIWQHIAKALIEPEKAVAAASIQDQDPTTSIRKWKQSIPKRATALFKSARMR